MNKLFTQEFIEKTQEAKSAAEIQSIARDNGVEITQEEAAQYFENRSQKIDNIDDEELANLAGGARCSEEYASSDASIIRGGGLIKG